MSFHPTQVAWFESLEHEPKTFLIWDIPGADVINKLLHYIDIKHSDWLMKVTWLILINQSALFQWSEDLFLKKILTSNSGSFSVNSFRSLQTVQFLNLISVKYYPSCQDLNTRPLNSESPEVTTRQGTNIWSLLIVFWKQCRMITDKTLGSLIVMSWSSIIG